jgi:hypothetical protein
MPSEWGDAWEQCYRCFGESRSGFDEENACLRLAFYLANFGMFRASGKLRGLSHYEYLPLVRICRSHSWLRGREPKFLRRNLGEVQSLLAELEVALKKLGVSPTSTLVSKIALATTASVPGYDRFVVAAIRARGLVASTSERALSCLYKYSEEVLVPSFAARSSPIPTMRRVDEFFWREGGGA